MKSTLPFLLASMAAMSVSYSDPRSTVIGAGGAFGVCTLPRS